MSEMGIMFVCISCMFALPEDEIRLSSMLVSEDLKLVRVFPVIVLHVSVLSCRFLLLHEAPHLVPISCLCDIWSFSKFSSFLPVLVFLPFLACTDQYCLLLMTCLTSQVSKKENMLILSFFCLLILLN